MSFMSILNSVPEVGPRVTELVWNRAFSRRLGVMDRNLTWVQVIEEAVKKGISLPELMAIPEKEEWLYDGKAQYVCSSFAVALYFHGGMFGSNITIVPQEFTPNDVMSLAIWDKDYVLPAHCKTNDSDLPYCQLDGMYKVLPKHYNIIQPYDHMNEHCPIKAPMYKRPNGC
jgi:hypothetical protein